MRKEYMMTRELMQRSIDALMECDRDGDYPLIDELRAALAALAAPADECTCDTRGLGVPGVTCGDCPRDYVQAAPVAPAIPLGYALVPVEPTDAMLRDSSGEPVLLADDLFPYQSSADDVAREIYRAMVAAATKVTP